MARTLKWPAACRGALSCLRQRAALHELGSGLFLLLMALQFGGEGLRAARMAPQFQMALLERWSTTTDIGALALLGYREAATMAGGFPADATMDDMMTTQWVFKNRYLTRFHQLANPVPRSYIDVVWEPQQASWTSWGYVDKFWVKPRNYGRLLRALVGAWHVMEDTERGLEAKKKVGPAKHYFNPDTASPKWARSMLVIGTYGHHLFKWDASDLGWRDYLVEAYYWMLTHPARKQMLAMK